MVLPQCFGAYTFMCALQKLTTKTRQHAADLKQKGLSLAAAILRHQDAKVAGVIAPAFATSADAPQHCDSHATEAAAEHVQRPYDQVCDMRSLFIRNSCHGIVLV